MLIPLGTDRPLRRTTVVTFGLIAACIALQVYVDTALRVDRGGGGLAERAGALMDWATLYPVGDSFPGSPGFHWWQLVTYAFVHGGWMHLLGNMLVLWVFGPNLEDRLGRIGFLVFYLAGAAASGGLHIVFSGHPVIGASGAIAACTGAYLMMFPRTYVKVLFLLGLSVIQISAVWFIAASIAWDMLSGGFGGYSFRMREPMGDGSGGGGEVDNVAHLAHLGGYGFGILMSLGLLWLKIVPREQFDLFSIGKQAYRRRAFKEAGRQADQRMREKWEKAKRGAAEAPGGVDPDVIAAARADVVTKLGSGEFDAGARAYKELADRYAHVPGATTLSRRWQYELANGFYQAKDHEAAAFAYARFLEAYPKDPEAGHIRLLLGMVHARSMNDPVKAKALIGEALKTLEGGEAEMARRELEALG